MDKPEAVRIADETDIANLFWHLMAEQETDWPMGLPPDERQVLSTVKAACTRDNSCAGIIDGPNGTILGSICIRAEVPWFTDVTILAQVWLFLDPRVREGARYADDLFKFAQWHRQDMSERVGYNMILENAVLSSTRLQAKVRLWGRYGEQVGAIFWNRGDQSGEKQYQTDGADADDGTDRPSGNGGVRESVEQVPERGQPAAPALRRPDRRAAEQLAESSDRPDSELRKHRRPVFD